MLNTILVALDQSELSDQIVQALHQMQLQTVTRVVLTYVIAQGETEVEVAADRPHVETEAGNYQQAEKWLRSYQAEFPWKSDLEIVTGDPAEEIVRLAHIHKADLVVLGSRGLTGLKRIISGSVSSQVVMDAPCSVLVVKPR